MKPNRNHIYCPDCGRAKIVFASKKKALNFIAFNGKDIYHETGKAPVRAYYCMACGGWHVTSRPYFRRRSFVERCLSREGNTATDRGGEK